ncbi:immunoglobulin domain-containing protein [Mariniflexile litorale]|uniref:Immunoglobulin domain-containing protein n=1 Tax=Mariniflexile litorale TaxID=3045158 RepID=A0AAU7EIF3_9FLAO|nr:immunoglobulin domain-containing protein [Mariniflexile sp. KMM 9835]MDQ8213269.1 immunoglobulin domain-containing protein [Mariniflexile sp. KMM 9835]
MKIIFHKTILVLFFILSGTYSFGQTCIVPQSERDALVAFYNATNGPNWTNNTNWNTAAAVCDWYGVTVSNGSVASIVLENNNLNGTIPASIDDLTNLNYLNLYVNNLTGIIPSSIGNLSNLTDLRLSRNQLTGTIPSEIGNLKNLNIIYISNNQFSGNIPSELGLLPNLSELSLHKNQLTGSIPVSFGGLTGLNFLHLHDNQLSGALPSGLTTLNNLRGFKFENNKFVFEDFEAIHATLENNISSFYVYSPQAKVDLEETINLTEGSSYTFTTSLSSANNSYQWYKDGVAISGATSKDYTINTLGLTDSGVYHVIATNSIITGLTLERNTLTLSVTADTLPLTKYCYTAECGNCPDGIINYFDEYGVQQTLTITYNDGVVSVMSSSQPIISDYVSLVTCPTNIPPYVDAGVYASLIFPSNSFILNGSQSYDSDGTIVSYLWSKISGGTAIFADSNSSITEVTLLEVGTYVFELTVIDDDGAISTDTAIVFVLAENEEYTLPLIKYCYAGCANCPDGIIEYFNEYGVQQTLAITYDDGVVSIMSSSQPIISEYVSLVTCSTNSPPFANAGVDGSIVYPSNSFILNGTRSYDSDGIIVSYLWTKISGGTVMFADVNSYRTEVSSLETGTYVFQLTVTDDDGAISTDTVTVFVLEVGQENSFCSSEWENYPTVANLIPSGSSVFWYATETGGVPYNTTDELIDEAINFGGVTYWWDDTTDNILTRTATTVMIDQGTPTHNYEDEYQFLPTNATIANLQMSGTNIQWFNSAFSQTPLNPTNLLEHGATYYVEDVGISTCRLAVEVYVGTVPPISDNIQYICPGATLNDLVIIPEIGATLVWYDSDTEGNALSNTTLLQEDITYYAAQIGADTFESFERTPITVLFNGVSTPILPSGIQKFYSNQEHTVANLLAKGSNVKWYSQSLGGSLYDSTTILQDNTTYYAQQTDGNCISERIPVVVDILDEELPTIISCEKFKPQLGGHYVISGWVREQGASATPGEIHDFTEVSDLFVELLNHLKNKVLSDNLFELDIPSDVYIPESNIDFDPLIPFVQEIQSDELKLTVYDFKRIEDDFGGVDKGRTIGFSFYLNKSKTRFFEYRTPEITVELCPNCNAGFKGSARFNYPLLGNDLGALNFTNARVSNGILYVTQSFNASNPSLVINNQEIQISGTSMLSESITYYDYNEGSNYQPVNYEYAQIELTYIGGDDLEMTNETLIFSSQGAIIDGWQRVLGEFTIPVDAKLLNINLKSNSTSVNTYFDDIRIHPFDSNMKTFVYHPETQRLMSELDENNYATFYEYDLEGGLVRVKKETEKGVYTIQETRSGNVKATN